MTQTSIPQDAAARKRRGANHRATVRYRCAPATLGRLYAGEDHEYQRAWMLDVAPTGVGFMLTRPIPADIAVVIYLRGRLTGTEYALEALVIHCTAQHDGEWLVGCSLTQPLTDGVLDDLL